MAFMACMERHKCGVGQLHHADEHCMASVMLGAARAEINPGPQPVPGLTRDNPNPGLTQDIPPVGSGHPASWRAQIATRGAIRTGPLFRNAISAVEIEPLFRQDRGCRNKLAGKRTTLVLANSSLISIQ